MFPMALTPEERTLRARIAAHEKWSRTDRAEGTRKAREAAERRFEDQVDPDRTLDPEERARRVASARKAQLTRMAFKSARARAARKAAKEAHDG